MVRISNKSMKAVHTSIDLPPVATVSRANRTPPFLDGLRPTTAPRTFAFWKDAKLF